SDFFLQNMDVLILSRKLITPSSPTTGQLSSLDQLPGPIYLQESLSETFTLYYPLAGRYIKDKLSVECNDKGAEYLEAWVSGCLPLSQLLSQDRSQLLSKWFHKKLSKKKQSQMQYALGNELVPSSTAIWFERANTPNVPLLANYVTMVQFNIFECGGVAIVACIAHRVADGLSCFNFIESWAKISRVGLANLDFAQVSNWVHYSHPEIMYLLPGKCNDKGAEFLEARVSGCLPLSQLLSQDRSQLLSKWFDKLVTDPVESDTTPLVIVQFNMFECGGVAIGACIAHRVADGLSCFNFIETWAKISRVGLANLEFCPSFKLESWKYRPTRVEVVLAFIWMCLIRLNKARHGYFRPSLLSTAVSMRKKTILPIPENSFGNTLTRAVARFFPDDYQDSEGNVQLQDLAKKIHHAIKSSVENVGKASNADEIVSLIDNANEELFKGRDEPDTDCYISSSWCRFPIYEADHGWGKPSWVTMPLNQKLRNRLVFSAAAISTLKGIATGTGSTDSESLKHQPTRVENSFGNIVVQAVARFFPDGKWKLELHDLAGKIHHAIRSTLSNCAKATNADDIVSLVNKANEELQLAKDTPDVDWYASTSWCRFPIYEADHGWGKPSWVSVPMFPNMRDVIVLMDTKDGDGVEALVALDERSMHFFEQDPEILPFLGSIYGNALTEHSK
ncbi:hypothetical protein Tsubulata_019871, partial [Turnera subulata]